MTQSLMLIWLTSAYVQETALMTCVFVFQALFTYTTAHLLSANRNSCIMIQMISEHHVCQQRACRTL